LIQSRLRFNADFVYYAKRHKLTINSAKNYYCKLRQVYWYFAVKLRSFAKKLYDDGMQTLRGFPNRILMAINPGYRRAPGFTKIGTLVTKTGYIQD